MLIVANLINNHPKAFSLFSSAIISMIPESFILRPILKFFGFGIRGPAKGSIAAAAQRFFFGANVPKGSWFAWLQKGEMKWTV